MIDVFYSPGKGIYLSDVFCQENLLWEFDQTGQVTIIFRGFSGQVEASYPTEIANSRNACYYLADIITRKLLPYFRNTPVKTGVLIETSTEIMSNGKTGVFRLVFQIVPA